MRDILVEEHKDCDLSDVVPEFVCITNQEGHDINKLLKARAYTLDFISNSFAILKNNMWLESLVTIGYGKTYSDVINNINHSQNCAVPNIQFAFYTFLIKNPSKILIAEVNSLDKSAYLQDFYRDSKYKACFFSAIRQQYSDYPRLIEILDDCNTNGLKALAVQLFNQFDQTRKLLHHWVFSYGKERGLDTIFLQLSYFICDCAKAGVTDFNLLTQHYANILDVDESFIRVALSHCT